LYYSLVLLAQKESASSLAIAKLASIFSSIAIVLLRGAWFIGTVNNNNNNNNNIYNKINNKIIK
jgi:hypothetical protein